MLYDSALYKFTIDIDIDISHNMPAVSFHQRRGNYVQRTPVLIFAWRRQNLIQNMI